jgi:hypothetical protein
VMPKLRVKVPPAEQEVPVPSAAVFQPAKL